MPKVSVIVPIYNTEKYLDRCLQSLVSQSLDDIEFIWVDNGANQACKDILKKYENCRPNTEIIHLEKNAGYGGGMNAGLDVATGEYIGFCDSDDWVDQDFYEKLYSVADKQKSDVVYAEYLREYSSHSVLAAHRTKENQVNNLEDKLAIIRDGAVWDKIFRRDMIVSHNICFPVQSKSYYEDNVFLFPAVCFANAVSLVFNVNYHYLQRDNSMINNQEDSKERDAYKINVIAYIINYAIKQNFSLASKLECLKFLNRSLGLLSILKQKDGLQLLLGKINKDNDFIELLSKVYSAHHPSFFQKFCSIQNDLQKNILWLCGLKIKLKNKEKNI